MQPVKTPLSQKDVKRLFSYTDCGTLVKKVALKGKPVGSVVGSECRGYLTAKVKGKQYLVHRLVWLWHYGYMPEGILDHIDRNKKNNRIDNLREVSAQCNLRNASQQVSTSGEKGVSRWKKDGEWQVHIYVTGKAINLGTTKCLLEAACLRLAAEQCVGWSGCDSTSPAYLFVKNHRRCTICA